MKLKKNILFIDGENFLFAVATILKEAKLIRHKSDITKISINKMVKEALASADVQGVKFYAGKIHIAEQPDLKAKSRAIAETQRRLKRYLVNEGVEFILAGHVRLQATKQADKNKTEGVFKEKGTDVRLAVDMISMACDDLLDIAILLSSDSDMQPAVKETRRRGVKVIYVGFENSINIGLTKTTNSTILIRKNEVISAWKKANPKTKR